MSFKTNFSDVTVSDFDALPAGNYPVYITDAELKQSGPGAKNPGADYTNWEFTVVEDHPMANRKLWTITSHLPKALFALKGLLLATGKWTEEEINAEDFEWDYDDVQGEKIIVKVTKYRYKDPEDTDPDSVGDWRNNIKGFKPFSEAGAAKASSGGSLLP